MHFSELLEPDFLLMARIAVNDHRMRLSFEFEKFVSFLFDDALIKLYNRRRFVALIIRLRVVEIQR